MSTKFTSKFVFLFYILLVASIIVTACGTSSSAAQETLNPTIPTYPPFSENVTIQYQYKDVPEEWVNKLPTISNVEATFNDEGWSIIVPETIDYAGVTLFNLEVVLSENTGETTFEGCGWEYSGSEYDDALNRVQIVSFVNCTTLEPETVIPVQVTVTMAYCSPFKNGLLCKMRGLTVFVADDYVNFSAEENFLPQYREWVWEVLEYKGGGELPSVLKPGYNYTVPTK